MTGNIIFRILYMKENILLGRKTSHVDQRQETTHGDRKYNI